MAPRPTPQPLREHVVFERSGKWWAAELPSFPGAYGQGTTQEAAYLNLLSAIRDLATAYAEQAAKEHVIEFTGERRKAAAAAKTRTSPTRKGTASPTRKVAAARRR
jgi:hypothetical protein